MYSSTGTPVRVSTLHSAYTSEAERGEGRMLLQVTLTNVELNDNTSPSVARLTLMERLGVVLRATIIVLILERLRRSEHHVPVYPVLHVHVQILLSAEDETLSVEVEEEVLVDVATPLLLH